MRVAIIGGGVMGCASALALADRGADVVVLERSVPGAEASSAAAGVLGAQVELHERERDVAPFMKARAAWRPWAEALREQTGIDVGWRASGVLRVAFAPEQDAQLDRLVAWQVERGLTVERLDGAAAREIEPELSSAVTSAVHFREDAQVDPPALLRALMVALARHPRITVRAGASVARLVVERDRCLGVQLEDDEVRADATVLAAGSWSSLVPGVPSEVPTVRPVRGQMVQLEERPPRARVIVFGPAGYVVPRGDGRVVCGSTMELAGFRREVTAGGVRAILASAIACLPALEGAQLAGTWCNFRPQSSGDSPLVGASPLPGLFLATGHHRNGILLAKLTADQVAEAIVP